jgi:hypothetical protein
VFRRAVVVVVVGCAALLLTAASALALTVTVEEGSAGVTTGTQGDAQADCPDGARVLGGGITNSGGYDTGYVNAAYPADGSDTDERSDDAWRGYLDANANVTLTLRVACLHGAVADALKYKTSEVRVPSHQSKGLAVSCPKGYTVTGGGVTNSGIYGQVAVKESRPIDRGAAWKGKVDNISSRLRKLTVSAVCARGKVAKRLSYRDSRGTAPSGGQASEGTDCPVDGEPIAAGVNVGVRKSNVNTFNLNGDGATSYLDALGNDDVKFTNYVVCLREA